MKLQNDPPPVILWFRQDLRVIDHPALNAATASGAPVIPVFILDEKTAGVWRSGAASRWWLAGSLAALDTALRSRDSRLILRRGEAGTVLRQLITETGATRLYFTRCYDPHLVAEETAIAESVAGQGIDCRRFGGGLLHEPEAVKTKTGGPFRVFTPFYKAFLATADIKAPLPGPDNIKAPETWPVGDTLDSWQLRPTAPDWAEGLRAQWTPGSEEATTRLASFLEDGVRSYPADRDRPDRDGTSTLSPYLHFGDISPRQIWHRTRLWTDSHGEDRTGGTAFLRELIWREFSTHSLFHFPTLTDAPFNATFEKFPWQENGEALAAWQKGRTGYPIVDAGMRQLWHTGWMHNRVRMVVASFLTKHLLIHWQEGARWFWDTLVDADLANNTASWQWVAGCGADAAPYFRIFNPILQGQKFDPTGAYVRHWVPELKDLPDRAVHAPWQSGGHVEGYPGPLIDHKIARDRALAAYKDLRGRDS